MRGWHPDVEDDDVGSLLAEERHEVDHVAGLADDVEAGLPQQVRDAIAEQRRVIGDDYPHGSAALMWVPCPGTLSIRGLPE